MSPEISDEAFYVESADLFSRSPLHNQLYLFTKTPSLLSVAEQHTEGRARYVRELLAAAKQARHTVRYCFRWDSTAELLTDLFTANEELRGRQLAQLQEVKALINQGSIDLRWTRERYFRSGLVGRDIAMLHNKDPNGIYTVSVDLLKGDVVAQHFRSSATWSNILHPLDDESLTHLIRQAKRRCADERLVAHVSQAIDQHREYIAELEKTETSVLEHLRLQPTCRASSRARVSLWRANSPTTRPATPATTDASDARHQAGGPSPPAVTDASSFEPRRRPRIQPFSFRTPAQQRPPDAHCPRHTHPIVFLEALILADGSPLSFPHGFFIFPKWRTDPPQSPASAFAGTKRALCRYLKQNNEAWKADIVWLTDEQAYQLRSINFDSDAHGAVKQFQKAQEHFAAGRPEEALAALESVKPFFSVMPRAALLAVACLQNNQACKSPRAEIPKELPNVLRRLVRDYGQALDQISKLASDSEVADQVASDHERWLRHLRAGLAAVEDWFEDDFEVPDEQERLRRLRAIVQRLATEELSEQKARVLARALASSEPGRAVRRRLGRLLRRTGIQLEKILPGVAPEVLRLGPVDMQEFENALTKTAHACLRLLDTPDNNAKGDGRQLARATWELRQQAEGQAPSPEQVRSYLGWTQRRFEEAQRSSPRSYDPRVLEQMARPKKDEAEQSDKDAHRQ